MDFNDLDDDFDFPATECRENLSFQLNEETKNMVKRDDSSFLRPICIDAIDISCRYNRSVRKNVDILPIDQSLFNVRSITITLWYFISRGHTALAFLPSTLREFAIKCTDPHELFILSKLDLITFENSLTYCTGYCSFSDCFFFSEVSSSIELSKSIASCARTSNGIIVGSRKKYCSLAKKFPMFVNVFSNGFYRPSFGVSGDFKPNNDVRLVLNFSEIDENQDLIAFQLPVTDQLFIMNRISKLLADDNILEICSNFRNLLDEEPLLKNQTNKLHNKTNSHENIYNYHDPFLPEYVAPPPPKVFDIKKMSRIGHKNSIYRVGGDVDETTNDIANVSLRKGPLIDALTQIFGNEKALNLVNSNPEMDDINELIELAWQE